jgi:hypothetical protein
LLDVPDRRFQIADRRLQIADYCRQIETYLCRKNDGHLIRVVGPAFDLVTGWAVRGVPLKVAFNGIDRCFDRYHRTGTRRRPLHIAFCEADVLDAFDEWRRAVGLPASLASESAPEDDATQHQKEPSGSLASHLSRAVMRLTSARANGSIGEEFDRFIDRIASELDVARQPRHGLRGAARQQLLMRLASVDSELLDVARAALDDRTRADLMGEADAELERFRDRMTRDDFDRAREAAFDRLVRERFDLPVITFQ